MCILVWYNTIVLERDSWLDHELIGWISCCSLVINMATVVRKKIVKEAGQPVDELEEQVAQVRERQSAAGGGAVVD